MAAREIEEQNKMRRMNFGCRDSPCSPLHAVSQVNKTKNTNGMSLGAYTEELKLVPNF
jgi:hypothetical protein